MIQAFDVYPSGVRFEVELTPDGVDPAWSGDPIILHVVPTPQGWNPTSGAGVTVGQIGAIEALLIETLNAAIAGGGISQARLLRKDEQATVSATRP